MSSKPLPTFTSVTIYARSLFLGMVLALLMGLLALANRALERRMPDSWLPSLVPWAPFALLIAGWAVFSHFYRQRAKRAGVAFSAPLDTRFWVVGLVALSPIVLLGNLGLRSLERRMPDSWLPVLVSPVPMALVVTAWTTFVVLRGRRTESVR